MNKLSVPWKDSSRQLEKKRNNQKQTTYNKLMHGMSHRNQASKTNKESFYFRRKINQFQKV